MKGVEELVSRGSEHLGISGAKAGETGSSSALGLAAQGYFFCHQRDRNAGEMVQSCLLN